MLEAGVVDAVAGKRFHIYTMERIDDAIGLMFGAADQPASVAAIDEALGARLEQLHNLWRDAHRGNE
jgi:predicted ATP-dependent protease